MNENFEEYNQIPKNEYNETSISNENILFDERNLSSQITTTDKTAKHENRQKNISFIIKYFIFLAIAIAITIPGVYIPIISTIFAPTTITYNFTEAKSNIKAISFNLNIKNEKDFSKSDYAVCLLEKANANNEYISSISTSLINAHKINITKENSTGSFTTYLSKFGETLFNPAETYTLILIHDGKIVCSQDVRPLIFKYVTDVHLDTTVSDLTNRYLDIWIDINPEFDYANNLYYQLGDQFGNPIADAYSIMPASSPGSKARFSIKLEKPPNNYTLKIYCSTDKPEKFTTSPSITHDETKYYLIYTHNTFILF